MANRKDRIKVLVVGGSSRAARAFRRSLSESVDFHVTTLARSPISDFPNETIIIADHFAPSAECFNGVDVIINFAGMTHGRASAALFAVNAEGPKRLAEAAKRHGVRHFMQLSSLHVYGLAENISRSTPENPHTEYGRSKLAADRALEAMSSDDFIVTLLRLPVLYGGGAGDNLRRLGQIMARLGWFPVPHKLCERSVLHVNNLAAVLQELVRCPARGVQFAADSEPLTLDTLAIAVADQFRRPIRLVVLPQFILLTLAAVSRSLYNSLCGGSFVAQTECIRMTSPNPVTLKEGLRDLFA